MSDHQLTSPDGLRAYAERITYVWADWSDEDVSELAQAAAAALQRLTARIEKGR